MGGVEPPEDVEISDCSDDDLPNPQIDDEDRADDCDEHLSDAEEQSYHLHKATFPVLSREIESVLPDHDDLPKLVAGLEESRGTKKEETYLENYLQTARSSLPAFSTTPAEKGFCERRAGFSNFRSC